MLNKKKSFVFLLLIICSFNLMASTKIPSVLYPEEKLSLDLGNMHWLSMHISYKCASKKELCKFEKSIKKIVKLLTDVAADQVVFTSFGFDPDFMQGLGYFKLEDYKKAADNFLKAAEHGSVEAKFYLGQIYHDGLGVEKDINKSFKWIISAAKAGHLDAQYIAALYYKEGVGVTRDIKETNRLLKLAASQGHLRAQSMIDGVNVILKDNEEGGSDQARESIQEQLMDIAAISGYVSGSCVSRKENAFCGKMDSLSRIISYLGETKTEGNWLESNSYLYPSLQHGISLFKLKKYKGAQKYFLEAAEEKNKDAQFFLGYMYFTGLGVEKDYVEAAKWNMLAAKQGHVDAQFNCGVNYESGFGVQQNIQEAYKWYKLSAMRGLSKAYKEYQSLNSTINSKWK